MIKMKPLMLLLMLLPLISTLNCVPEPVEPPNAVPLQTTVIAQNLSAPWEILWGPDNFIWMTQKAGDVFRVNPSTGEKTLLLTVPFVGFGAESGLLGMVLHPDFSSNPYVYLVYVTNTRTGERVDRYTYSNGKLVDPVNIIANIPGFSEHVGSRLVIVGDKLFVSTGDAHFSNGSDPQSTGNLGGKILRVNLDGSIPADNPNRGSAVWSIGHRNPQGLVFANNRLYSSEHGGDDEVNIIKPGKNYGWPLIDGKADTPGENEEVILNQAMTLPIYTWMPGQAPSGMDYYNNNAIPQWKNSLLVATLNGSSLYQVKLNADNETVSLVNRYFELQFGRLRDVCISPAGDVYVCTSNRNMVDQIIKISPVKQPGSAIVK